MRLLPRCGEGFRRLSILLAILTFIVLFVRWYRDDLRNIEKNHQMCYTDFALQQQDCNEATGHSDPQTCFDKADKKCAECIKNMSRTWSVVFTYWGLYAIGGLFGAYITILATRSIGWVVLGFK